MQLEVLDSEWWLKKEEFAGAYCEVTITAIVQNPDTHATEKKEITSLRATYDEECEITFNSTKDYPEPNLTEQYNVRELKPFPLIKDDEGKQLYADKFEARRKFEVRHPQPFSWVNDSTPFTDTPQNRALLWEKYEEVQQAIFKRDRKALRQLAEPGVTDVALFEGDTPNNHFDVTTEMLIEPFFGLNRKLVRKVDDRNDYNLELYAGGKLFRLVKKGRTSSPILWKSGNWSIGYNPIFTFIDGKIVMAIY